MRGRGRVRGRGGVRGRGQQPCYGSSRSSTKGWGVRVRDIE